MKVNKSHDNLTEINNSIFQKFNHSNHIYSVITQEEIISCTIQNEMTIDTNISFYNWINSVVKNSYNFKNFNHFIPKDPNNKINTICPLKLMKVLKVFRSKHNKRENFESVLLQVQLYIILVLGNY